MLRFRNLRIWPQIPPIPEAYRIGKISHWLKDHLRRIKDTASDAVCRAATGFDVFLPADDLIATFNGHIAPIGKLYGFQLEMVGHGDTIVLRGDIAKALSVLTYLSSQSRTPETDWLLDVVTVLTSAERPLDWEVTWKSKLRHTKRGRFWLNVKRQRPSGKADAFAWGLSRVETKTTFKSLMRDLPAHGWTVFRVK
jgi:hypothetical protein